VIQGLRLAPWVQAIARREDLAIADCEKCMEMTTKEQRQAMGCGYELAAPEEMITSLWSPPDGKAGFRHNPKLPLLPVCAGYTTKLPEVWEALRAWRHWQKGELQSFCGGMPTGALLIALEIFDGEVNACNAWEMTPESEGGGRK